MPLEGKFKVMADTNQNATATTQVVDPVIAPEAAPSTAPNANADTVVARVNSTSVYTNEKGTTLYLRLNKKFKAMRQGEDLMFREVDENQLGVPMSVLLELLMEDIKVAIFINTLPDKKDAEILSTLLTHATVAFENVKHLKGEVIDGAALARDSWFKTLIKAEVKKDALDAAKELAKEKRDNAQAIAIATAKASTKDE